MNALTTTQDLYQRVAALSQAQRVILAQRLSAPNSVPKKSQAPARLVAYVVPELPEVVLDGTVLRDTLKSALPAHMVPAVIVPLAALPRTANGKVDVKALPDPQSVVSSAAATAGSTEDSQSALLAPQSPAEKTLCQIWQDVLGLSAIGIHDNFFELGGDSILSIQIVSKARDAGLRLAPNQLFEQPTIAELAAVVNLSPAVRATQAAVTGPVPLTPIQHWFFEQKMVASQHWHQAILLELPPSVGFEQVERAIATLWRHHDALRLHFLQVATENSTGWRQINTDAEKPPRPVQVDLSSVPTAEQSQSVAKYGSRLHAGLSRVDGNALQAAHFLLGENRPSWLLISLHHLVVDGVSWQILQNDLRTLLSSSLPDTALQDAALQDTVLPDKTTSFKVWAETLVRQAANRQPELPYWLAQLEPALSALPQDVSEIVSSTEGTAHTLTVRLDEADTHNLLKTVPAAYNTQINDVLLTALTQSLLPWINQTASDASSAWRDYQKGGSPSNVDSIRIDIEGHGRQQIVEDVDLSRTVGWFTAVYPMQLQLNDATDVGGSLKAIKEQLRQIPDRGIGYGMLRYLSDEVTRQLLAQFSPSEVLFNYLGQREAGESLLASPTEPRVGENSLRMIKDIDLGTLRSPDNSRSYLLEINAWVSDGQLHLNWTYDTQRYGADTIFSVANHYLRALKSTIAHCVAIAQSESVTRGGFTPSDFPGVAFTQSELDGFIRQLKPAGLGQDSIEAIYPLAPLQQAFLWHALQDSSQAGLLHMRGTLHGELDFERLRQAWEQVVGCHLALRTSVHWQAVPQPVQVAARQLALPWQQLDWRDRENPQQALVEFLEADRTLGFDFAQGPIMRLTLIRVGDRTTEMVWTCHHLMLDGWSGTLVVNQVLDAYEALQQGKSLATGRVPSHQDYIHWLNKQDEDAAECFWRDRLKGFATPTPLPVALEASDREVGQALPVDPLSLALSAEETGQLKDFLRSHRLTLNTLIQGTWALLLSLRTGQSDILFGATVSGRQAELAQVESIVGLLINVLPVRVTMPAEETAVSWLQSLQVQQAETSRYAYAAPAQIQGWSECSGRLFNSLLVIENYPTRAASDNDSPSRTLRLENLKSGIISTYGLTIIVKPDSDGAADNDSGFTLFADAQGATPESLRALLAGFRTLLMGVVSMPTSTVEQLLLSAKLRALPTTPQQNLQPTPSSTCALSAIARDADRATGLPRTPRELQLSKIWASVLGVVPLSTEASFFDLGGDSLLAVQLFNQMQQQLDCTLPLATLFQAPTVRLFAALMDEESSDSASETSHSSQLSPSKWSRSKLSKWSSLVPIQPNGSRRPFFFHGGSADALTWARFSKLLGPYQPFYALQRPDLDGSDITYKSVEALAIACIDELRTVQPTGPYIIGGHCFGGAVAFEMAKQLQLQGETVRGLIEIDAYCPNALPYSTFGQLQEQLQLTYFLLRKSYYYHGGRKLMQLPKKIWHRLRPAASSPNPPNPELNVDRVSATGVSSSNHRSVLTLPQQTTHLPYEDRYARAHQANIRAADVYYPGEAVEHYSGPLKIFRADVQILDWRYGPHLGWQTVTRDAVETTNIPGLFGNLFNQRSGPLLAQQVKAYLDTLQ